MAGILNAIEISSQGLSVQRRRMNAVAENIANAETTRTEDGGPYRRQRVLVSQDKSSGTFASALNQAGLRLARTNSRHLPSQHTQTSRRLDLPAVTSDSEEAGPEEFRLIHDPSHPDADEEGFVRMPDIDVVTEMVDMMAAMRSYEANTVAISTAKQMAKAALDI